MSEYCMLASAERMRRMTWQMPGKKIPALCLQIIEAYFEKQIFKERELMKIKKEHEQEARITEIIAWTFVVGLIYILARMTF